MCLYTSANIGRNVRTQAESSKCLAPLCQQSASISAYPQVTPMEVCVTTLRYTSILRLSHMMGRNSHKACGHAGCRQPKDNAILSCSAAFQQVQSPTPAREVSEKQVEHHKDSAEKSEEHPKQQINLRIPAGGTHQRPLLLSNRRSPQNQKKETAELLNHRGWSRRPVQRAPARFEWCRLADGAGEVNTQ